eukprot:15364359-Ditylum_brightwellii.AAC.1
MAVTWRPCHGGPHPEVCVTFGRKPVYVCTFVVGILRLFCSCSDWTCKEYFHYNSLVAIYITLQIYVNQ